MLYCYIFENLCSYINGGAAEAGDTDFDYAVMPNEKAEEACEGLVEEKGFFILPPANGIRVTNNSKLTGANLPYRGRVRATGGGSTLFPPGKLR